VGCISPLCTSEGTSGVFAPSSCDWFCIKTLYFHLAFYGVHAILIVDTRILLLRRLKKKQAASAIAGKSTKHLHALEDLTDSHNPDFR
jgi:hypothetical protein